MLTAVAPAQAAPPQSTPYEFSGEEVFFTGCPGGYDVLIQFSGRGLNKVFYDKEGNVVRIWDWAKASGTLINSTDPTQDRNRVEPQRLRMGTSAT